MLRKLALFAGTALIFALPAQAMDCGEPPIDPPIVPNGAGASADQIRVARDAVLAYSSEVDRYIACMDQNVAKVAPYMTKEQLERRQDDLNNLHNERRDLQIALNEAIRAYRRQPSGR